jgi:hypothetical protein
VLTVGLGVLLALGLGVLLSREFRGRTLARTLLVPWAIPPVVNGLMWKFIYDANYGVANAAVRGLGLSEENIAWLGTQRSALEHREVRRTAGGRPEVRAAQLGRVVVQTDERPAARSGLQDVVQRQPARIADGVDEQHDDDGERRQRHEQPEAAVCCVGRPPPARGGGNLDGACLPRDGCGHPVVLPLDGRRIVHAGALR